MFFPCCRPRFGVVPLITSASHAARSHHRRALVFVFRRAAGASAAEAAAAAAEAAAAAAEAAAASLPSQASPLRTPPPSPQPLLPNISNTVSASVSAPVSASQVNFWTDYLKAPFHPRTPLLLRGVWAGVTPFAGFGDGRALREAAREAVEEAVDRVRWVGGSFLRRARKTPSKTPSSPRPANRSAAAPGWRPGWFIVL